ncbi:MAG: type II toxin-antitoxin system RelE/ParE family toxin [Candidatus Bathyarchaeia archaeon]
MQNLVADPLFTITIAKQAQRSSKKLPEHIKRRIVELLLILRENPVPAEYYDVKKLKGLADSYRIRIGDFRIVYEIVWDKAAVNILYIGPRESAYS